MKKILLLFVVMAMAFTYTSCSDDDGPTIIDPSEDPILGKWQLIEEKVNGEIEPVDCDYTGFLFIDPDSTWAKEIYEEDAHGECTFMQRTEQGTWENLGNSNYEFIFEGEATKGKIEIIKDNNIKFIFTYDDEGDSIQRTYLYK